MEIGNDGWKSSICNDLMNNLRFYNLYDYRTEITRSQWRWGGNITNASYYSISNMLKHTISRSLRNQAYLSFHRQSISCSRFQFLSRSHSMSPTRKIIIDTDPVMCPFLASSRTAIVLTMPRSGCRRHPRPPPRPFSSALRVRSSLDFGRSRECRFTEVRNCFLPSYIAFQFLCLYTGL